MTSHLQEVVSFGTKTQNKIAAFEKVKTITIQPQEVLLTGLSKIYNAFTVKAQPVLQKTANRL